MPNIYKKPANSRSPLTAAPRRQAGQSIEEERQRIFDDEVHVYFLASVIFILIAGMEWLRWYSKSPPQPWLISS